MSPAPGHAAAPSVERLYRLGNAWTRIDPIVSHNCSLSDDRDGGPAVPMSALGHSRRILSAHLAKVCRLLLQSRNGING